MPNNLNVLVLGQTGSGKSSLINYLGSLAGDKALAAGVGKPVTAEGDFTSVTAAFEGKDNVTITLADSWGLEPDKADRWQQLIENKLAATLDYNAMIAGIVYCLSYSQSRIQDFEIGILKKLLSAGYKIVIALTNADTENYGTKKGGFRNRLDTQLTDFAGQYEVIDICSVIETKIDGSSMSRFGKDRLLRQLEKDWRTNFTSVFLKNLDAWYYESKADIESFRTAERNLPLVPMKKKIDALQKQVENETEELWDRIFEKVKHNIEKAKNASAELDRSFEGAGVKFWSWDLLLLAVPAPPIWIARILFVLGKAGWFIFRTYRNRKRLRDNFIEVLNEIAGRISGEVDSFYHRLKNGIQ
ncbi:MAG: GTPase domain-containing protein [Planctomycetaceae bacterium]|jgi:GTPase SAR1 family protein|nr:GTPase domain-containing protein [Planctomycetaceae bacterium]